LKWNEYDAYFFQSNEEAAVSNKFSVWALFWENTKTRKLRSFPKRRFSVIEFDGHCQRSRDASMKFAKTIEEQAIAEWRSKYIDYKYLKKLIKKIPEKVSSAG
jgi:hypothetical protein